MSHDLHQTTSQNYANTQDKLEGLRFKLRDIENTKTKVLNEYNAVEANRAHLLARVGGVPTHPSYAAQLPTIDAQKKTYDDKLASLYAEHAAVKSEVDRLEGNPTQDSNPRSNAELANKNAIGVIEAVSSNKPVTIEDELDRPAQTEYVDDPNKSFGTIQAALMTAAGKEVERVVTQHIEAQFDREKTATKFKEVSAKAIDKAVSAPQFGEPEKNEVQAQTESYVLPPTVSKGPAGPEFVDAFEGQTHLDGTEDQSVSGLTKDVEAKATADAIVEETDAEAVKKANKKSKGEK